MVERIFYAAGPGDVIGAHQYWMRNEPDPTQLPIGYSTEFCEFSRAVGAEAYIVSYHERQGLFRDGQITLEHLPKRAPDAAGVRYHLRELFYALRLVWKAVRFRARWALLHSGSTHFFAMALFRLVGIRPVPMLHNTFWPAGFRPAPHRRKLIPWLNSLFFRNVAVAIVCISPECVRQTEEITEGRSSGIYEMRPQYRRETFAHITPPPPYHEGGSFNILFTARMDGTKGSLDLLRVARRIEDQAPGRVHFHVVGDGKIVKEFLRERAQLGLESVVSHLGWKHSTELRELIAGSHAIIVPTRSEFPEGLAKTAVEAVLSGRPVITSKVVPAMEILRAACVEAKTDDVDSYAEEILKLIDESQRYQSLCQACAKFGEQFYDGRLAMRNIMQRIICDLGSRTKEPDLIDRIGSGALLPIENEPSEVAL